MVWNIFDLACQQYAGVLLTTTFDIFSLQNQLLGSFAPDHYLWNLPGVVVRVPGHMAFACPHIQKAIGAIASRQMWTIGVVALPHTSHNTGSCKPEKTVTLSENRRFI